jgi:hypothetical protein
MNFLFFCLLLMIRASPCIGYYFTLFFFFNYSILTPHSLCFWGSATNISAILEFLGFTDVGTAHQGAANLVMGYLHPGCQNIYCSRQGEVVSNILRPFHKHSPPGQARRRENRQRIARLWVIYIWMSS